MRKRKREKYSLRKMGKKKNESGKMIMKEKVSDGKRDRERE